MMERLSVCSVVEFVWIEHVCSLQGIDDLTIIKDIIDLILTVDLL